MVQTLEVEGITNTGSRVACQLSSCLPVTMYMTIVTLSRKVIWATPPPRWGGGWTVAHDKNVYLSVVAHVLTHECEEALCCITLGQVLSGRKTLQLERRHLGLQDCSLCFLSVMLTGVLHVKIGRAFVGGGGEPVWVDWPSRVILRTLRAWPA